MGRAIGLQVVDAIVVKKGGAIGYWGLVIDCKADGRSDYLSLERGAIAIANACLTIDSGELNPKEVRKWKS